MSRTLSPSLPNERMSLSECLPTKKQATLNNQSPELDHHTSRPLASQSIDNAGLAMRRAMMLQRQNAMTEDANSYAYGHHLPCTPPRPPSHPRPKSAKKRPRSGSRPRSSSAIVSRPMSDPPTTPQLPPSPVSFSRYKPLPSINSSMLSKASSHSSISSHSNENINEVLSETNELTQKMSDISFNQQRNPPTEPSESEPSRINLAIKMLDGTRHERWFRQSDTIGDILCYAQSVTTEPLPDNCEICTNELPKRIFSDLSQTLEDVGLQSRTVLYIQER